MHTLAIGCFVNSSEVGLIILGELAIAHATHMLFAPFQANISVTAYSTALTWSCRYTADVRFGETQKSISYDLHCTL